MFIKTALANIYHDLNNIVNEMVNNGYTEVRNQELIFFMVYLAKVRDKDQYDYIKSIQDLRSIFYAVEHILKFLPIYPLSICSNGESIKVFQIPMLNNYIRPLNHYDYSNSTINYLGSYEFEILYDCSICTEFYLGLKSSCHYIALPVLQQVLDIITVDKLGVIINQIKLDDSFLGSLDFMEYSCSNVFSDDNNSEQSFDDSSSASNQSSIISDSNIMLLLQNQEFIQHIVQLKKLYFSNHNNCDISNHMQLLSNLIQQSDNDLDTILNYIYVPVMRCILFSEHTTNSSDALFAKCNSFINNFKQISSSLLKTDIIYSNQFNPGTLLHDILIFYSSKDFITELYDKVFSVYQKFDISKMISTTIANPNFQYIFARFSSAKLMQHLGNSLDQKFYFINLNLIDFGGAVFLHEKLISSICSAYIVNTPEPLPKIELSKQEVDLKLQNSFCDSLMLSNNIVSEQSQEYKKLDALLQDILIDYTDIDLNKQECKNYIYARIVERAVYTNNDALFQLLLKSFEALKSSNLLTVQTKQKVAFVQSTWAFQYALAHSKGYYLEEILNIVEDRMDKLRLFFSIDQFAPSFKISEMRLLMIKSPDQLLEMHKILLANSVQNISREEIPYQDIDVDDTVYCSLDGLYKETQCEFNNKSIIPILFCNGVDVYPYDEFIKVHLNIQDTIKYFNEFQDLIKVELAGFCQSVGLCSEGYNLS